MFTSSSGGAKRSDSNSAGSSSMIGGPRRQKSNRDERIKAKNQNELGPKSGRTANKYKTKTKNKF